jgi:cell division protein ZapA
LPQAGQAKRSALFALRIFLRNEESTFGFHEKWQIPRRFQLLGMTRARLAHKLLISAHKKNPLRLHSALQFRNMSAPVKVQIFGQIYSIRGELEEKYVQKLAKCVDEKMHAIAEATGIVDTQKLAVLAALAIADELHSLKTELTDEEELLREQAERCLTLVERALKQSA